MMLHYSIIFCGLFVGQVMLGKPSLAHNDLEAFAAALISLPQNELEIHGNEAFGNGSQDNALQEDLKNAIFDEDLERVRNALSKGADSDGFYEISSLENEPFITEYSALGLALKVENQDSIKLLLTKNPNLENVKVVWLGPQKVLSTSALYEAIESGNTDIVKIVLAKNPNLNRVAYEEKQKKSYSAMQIAIQKGDPEIVRLILKKLIEKQEPNIIKYSYWAHEALKKKQLNCQNQRMQYNLRPQ
jgi:hypothetical protein